MVFKQIFRVAFIALIWKQYKGLIISTAILIAFLLLVGSVHSDYLTHRQLQNDMSSSPTARGLPCILAFMLFEVHSRRKKIYPKRQSKLISMRSTTKTTHLRLSGREKRSGVALTSLSKRKSDAAGAYNAIRQY